jgi:hypothetical protein
MTLHVLVLLTFGIVCLAFGGTGRTASSGSRGPEPAMAIARCFRPGRALASTVTISALALVGGALPDSAGATTTAGTGTDCSYDHRRPQRAEARETIRVVHALAQGSAALTPCPAPSPSTSADRPGVAIEAADTTRVGRWMSPDEHAAMTRTGEVQVGAGGTTSVASPPNAESFMRQTAPGSRYVEFDVPSSSVFPGGTPEWGQIPGPGHILGRLAAKRGITLPSPVTACNIVHVATKLGGPTC